MHPNMLPQCLTWKEYARLLPPEHRVRLSPNLSCVIYTSGVGITFGCVVYLIVWIVAQRCPNLDKASSTSHIERRGLLLLNF